MDRGVKGEARAVGKDLGACQEFSHYLMSDRKSQMASFKQRHGKNRHSG